MKKVLMIATCNFIVNHKDGGRQCSYRNYKLLCEIFGKKNVHVCMISNEPVDEDSCLEVVPTYKNKVQQVWWALKLRNGYSAKTEKEIVKLAENEEIGIIWFDRSTLGGLCTKIQTKAMKIVFFHNVEKIYIKNKISHENFGYGLSYPAFARNEKKAVEGADKIICLNNRDSELLNMLYNRKADCLLPISFDDSLKTEMMEEAEGEKTLLFVGSFFQPNIEGINWLVENVMAKLPDIKLVIVGKGMERKRQEWKRKNVEVVGTVEDISEYYLKAGAVILPIFYGDGMKVKTAEALMFGKVIFGTQEALEGYEARGQKDIYECNTAEDFIHAVRKYFDVEQVPGFSESNRELFLNRYENQALKVHLEKFLLQAGN